MSAPHRTRYLPLVILSLAFSASAALAQAPITQETYKPTVGQAGKDAVWVPTSNAMIEKMLDMAKVTPKDFVMDLGSGDGRAIIAAARRGVPGLGVEYNNDLVEFSKRAAREAGVADKAQFVQGDMYAADISKATVLSLFLLPSNLEKLAPKFLDLPAGSRIVANTFWIQGWTPDETDTMKENCDNWCTAMLFIVPAKVAGRWRTDEGELVLTQQYQTVSGTFTPAQGDKISVTGRLRGNQLSLTVGDRTYEGRVDGDTMVGSQTNEPNSQPVTATRVK